METHNSVSPVLCTPLIAVLPEREELSFSVYYQWGLIWVGAGDLNLSLKPDPIPGQNSAIRYPHAVAIARTSPRLNRLFPVNDRYETWFEPQTILPLHFIRDISEGNAQFNWSYQFDRQNSAVHYQYWHVRRPERQGTLDFVPSCTQDLFSVLYYIRSIDWARYHPGQRVPVDMIIDGKTEQLFVKYVGKERIKTRRGYTDCLVLEPQLIEGDYFKSNEGLRLWLSDDHQRLPIRCEAKIRVGSLKADLM